MVWRKHYRGQPHRTAESQSLGGRIPVSGHFCVWPTKRACRRTKLSLFQIIRLLKGTPTESRPEWLVLENVKNLLSVNRGWDFATVLNSLAEIGYHIEYGLLNSRFHGVPQNRERIYLVAYRHFRANGERKVFPVTASDGKALIQLIGGTQGKRVYDPVGISCTLMSDGGGFGGRTGMYFIDLCRGNPKLTDNARCIKARYDGGITNHSGDNSGVLCMNDDCPDRTEEISLVQLKRGEPKLQGKNHTKCLIAGYNKIGVSNRGESSGVFMVAAQFSPRTGKTSDRTAVALRSAENPPFA